ncbi:EamA family transporter [Rhodobacteraceae bacterium 2376]|uniref:EamA family transporter n=1 Tax=Rhabdonatronobacter sediminivivens TaxID=2743469 RepID=A0A7Z0I0V4_9RHOB|nr:EamA family transporter [Rhabdonatronobacter sediminivivens]NYS25876.1 EamA family transporter [Rhabdonatronobacter sediminivivens]
MTVGVLSLVLLAALMHALWNALLKGAGDGTVAVGLIALGHVLIGLVLVIALPLPDPAAWPFIIASTVIHWFYYYLLNLAYRVGDLSVVYPIARGLTPMIIAIASWLILAEALSTAAWLGIAAISCGIFLLARPDKLARMPAVGLAAAVGTALTIAAYSMADGIGVRVSGNAFAYIGWLFLGEIFVAVWVLTTRRQRLRAVGGRAVVIALAGGVISALAYGMVLWAKTVAPLGLVSAMRETSVIFAALIGVIWFGERPLGPRLIASVVVCLGVMFIMLG